MKYSETFLYNYQMLLYVEHSSKAYNVKCFFLVLCLDKSCQNAGLDQSDMVLDYIGNCFQFLNVSKNYSDGDAECTDRGGFLTEILDESTNDLLVKQALYLKENNLAGENTAWWTGGYDDDDSLRSWYWLDSK